MKDVATFDDDDVISASAAGSRETWPALMDASLQFQLEPMPIPLLYASAAPIYK